MKWTLEGGAAVGRVLAVYLYPELLEDQQPSVSGPLLLNRQENAGNPISVAPHVHHDPRDVYMYIYTYT